MNNDRISPVKASERYVILDALRGFALLGICMANFPEFSLYTFLHDDVTSSMPTAGIDRVTKFLLYFFVDGKFYTLFSLLFGMGFSIILSNSRKKGINGYALFYRRMSALLVIGFLHLMFIWSGDILMLYALLGMLLPFFVNMTDRSLLRWAAALLFLPIVLDFICEITNTYPALPVVRLQEQVCARYGITDENFAYWLRDAHDYGGVFEFLLQGALVRVQEFIDGNRYFKVLGLFLIGFYIGRQRLFADLENRRKWLSVLFRYGLGVGLPISFLYALSGVNHHPLGLTAHSALYFFSVYPLGFAYAAGICLLYLRRKDFFLWKWLAAPGRMALTNYIGQSIIGMFLFYGIGLGLGAGIGLAETELVVFCVYAFQIAASRAWLSRFRFGPFERIWRMFTYGGKI